MRNDILRGCEIFTNRRNRISIQATELTEIQNIISIAIFLNGTIYPGVLFDLSMISEPEESKEEIELERKIIDIYKRDKKELGNYFTEEIEEQFMELAAEYYSRKFQIRSFDKQEVWAEIGQVLVRKHFQSKANYTNNKKRMLHEWRWAMKFITDKFLTDMKVWAGSDLNSHKNKVLLKSRSEEEPFKEWDLNEVEVLIDGESCLEGLRRVRPNLSAQRFVNGCKIATQSPPFGLDEMWRNLDKFLGFKATSERGLINSISEGKKKFPIHNS